MDNFSKVAAGLTPQQREVLLMRLAKLNKDKGETSHAQIPARGRESNIFPLSFEQEKVWANEKAFPGLPGNTSFMAVRLQGTLDIGVLESAVNEIVRRHEVLRTIFPEIEDSNPAQVVLPDLRLGVQVIDMQALPESQREAEAYRMAADETPLFDLSTGPLVDVRVLWMSEQDHILLVTMHLLFADGWSKGVFVKELLALYQAFVEGKPSPLSELSVQYADYTLWQREQLQGDAWSEQLSYWKEKLTGEFPVVELSTDFPRPAAQTFTGRRYSFEIPQELAEALKALSQREGATLFMTLLTAFKVLLFGYTGQEDMLVGSYSTHRNQPETQALIGFFINTLALRTDLSGNPTFRELLARVKETALGAFAHKDMPFDKLMSELQLEAEPGEWPLLRVMFVLGNVPRPTLETPGMNLSPLKIDKGTAKFDLVFNVEEGQDDLYCYLEYNTDLFSEETISRTVGHLLTLMRSIVAQPNTAISTLPMLTEAEQHQLLVEWNDTHVEYPAKDKNSCIHDLFQAQVERTPHAIALIDGEKPFAYEELNARANKLAHYLQTMGVGPETTVGVCMERSSHMVVALLAILKAGGAYVPLDPAYPKERLEFMLSDARVGVLLTQHHLVGDLPSLSLSPDTKVVCVDADWPLINQCPEHNPISSVAPSNLAYVIYTSGSTGTPKGVAIQHSNTVALLNWALDTFSAYELQGVLASTSICFDLSVFELFVPLSCGGTVILAQNALALPSLPSSQRDKITLVNTVPSAMTELLRLGAVPPSVCTVNLAGEPLHNKLVQLIYEQCPSVQRVYNLYGPSEDTTYSTFALVQKGATEEPSIGKPISNTQVYLLDKQGGLQLVPAGTPGEVYIAGDGLARGYLHREELTQEKFISNPFNIPGAGARLYKTGDLARYSSDGSGNIQFLGRMDHQVKIRGFRIELGEIEAVLQSHSSVQDVVVMALEDEAGDKKLVAYIVPVLTAPSTGELTSELRLYLKEKLPEYMVPSYFVMLEELPLTPNGKVDRKALPAFDHQRPQISESYAPPRTPTEQELASIWVEVLELEQVGIHDDFFELGGYSLQATQVMTRVRDAFQVELPPLESLFRAPTIAQFAANIEQKQLEQVDAHILGGLLAEIEQLSADQAQQALTIEK